MGVIIRGGSKPQEWANARKWGGFKGMGREGDYEDGFEMTWS